MMGKKVVVFGTGDFARIAYAYLSTDSPYEVVAFTVNEIYIKENEFMGLNVVPFENIQTTYPPQEYSMFVAIGFKRINKLRSEIYYECKRGGYELITYINSKALPYGEFEIGDNCFILESNVIQPFVRIGNNVIVWSGNHIGHDSKIGEHCFIASHAVISGNVKIGPYCFIGVNATLRDGITIAPSCVIGAGAVIMRDTREGEVYAAKNAEVSRVKSSELRGF